MPTQPPPQDFGLSTRLPHQRILNRNGLFNVRRAGLPWFNTFSLYHWLLTIPWPVFHLILILFYTIANGVFAIGYLLCGRGALANADGATLGARFYQTYFFSVQTFATIGYGKITPESPAANILAVVEAFVGPLTFALATGLLFARFSRPVSGIIFSSRAVVAPFREGKAFMFRIANGKRNEVTQIQAQLTFTTVVGSVRRYRALSLDRDRVIFLPLQWVVVHPIDEGSPFWGHTEGSFRQEDPEILILLTAVDETFAQTVHTRMSYRADEIVWDARFRDPYITQEDGRLELDLRLLGEVTPAPTEERLG